MGPQFNFTVGGKAFSISREEVERKLKGVQPEPIRQYCGPDSFAQVKLKDHLLYFSDTLLVADLPVSFHIALSASPEDKPWFSSEKPEDRLWRLLQKKLGNTESIAIFVPDRKIKITLPIPTRQSR